jgi:hypothetical protein
MLIVTYAECHIKAFYAEYSYAECCYAECHCAECRYAKCRYAKWRYAEWRYAEWRGSLTYVKSFIVQARVPKVKIKFIMKIYNL